MFEQEAIKMLAEGRVIFPLTDFKGNLTGIAARTHKRDEPTYKIIGSGIFGNTKTNRDVLIISEGVAQVLKAWQMRSDNVLGVINYKTLLSDGYLRQLVELNKKIILFFDNDELGQNESRIVFDKMKSANIEVYEFKSNKAVDLQDYLEKGYTIKDLIERCISD